MSLQMRSDGELLDEFASQKTEALFEEIIRRHGGLVLSVCRRVLGNSTDAEDAAQAVFLTLARKASTLRGNASVAAWLHHVAWCVASNARAARAARLKHEQEAAMHSRNVNVHAEEWAGLEAVIDREINTLPPKYRLPIVLFHLEGRSLDEICNLLNCKTGTLESWLTRGRAMLKERIERNRVAVSSAMLMALPARSAEMAGVVPAKFIKATTQAAARAAAGDLAAGGAVSSQTAALAQGAVRQMFMVQVRKVAAMVLLAAALSIASFMGYSHAATKSQVTAREPGESKPLVRAQAPRDEKPAPAPKAADATPDQIAEWIRQLGDVDIEVCLAAEEKLRSAGELASAGLKVAAKSQEASVAARAQRLLDVLKIKPLMDKIQASRDQMKSWEADSDVVAKMGGQDVTSTGHMIASADTRLLKLDGTTKVMGMEMPLKVRSDGTTYWSEVKIPTGQVMVQKSAVAAAGKRSKSRTMSYAFTELIHRIDFIEATEGELDGRKVYVISGLVKEIWANSETRKDMVKVMGPSMLDDLATMQKVVLSVDQETNYVLKSVILDGNNTILMSNHMRNVKINVPLDEKAFAYTPPKDASVMDVDAAATKKEPEAAAPPKEPGNF